MWVKSALACSNIVISAIRWKQIEAVVDTIMVLCELADDVSVVHHVENILNVFASAFGLFDLVMCPERCPHFAVF